jgi:transcriptional regulator with XRE-family HTH domain
MYSVYADLRDKMGVKDMDVSRALGFHPSVISDWKRGKATPKYDKLKQIADFFGVTVEYLTTGEKQEGYYINPQTAEMAQELFDNKELRLLFDVAKDVTPEQLKILQQMALSWKNQG